jgi:hypothetical protein
LVNQSYCINNKQYTKEEYQKEIEKIKPQAMIEQEKVM